MKRTRYIERSLPAGRRFVSFRLLTPDVPNAVEARRGAAPAGLGGWDTLKIVLSLRLGFACAAVQSALPSGKAKGKHGNPWICWCLEVDADFAIAAIDMISGNKHVVNFCNYLPTKRPPQFESPTLVASWFAQSTFCPPSQTAFPINFLKF